MSKLLQEFSGVIDVVLKEARKQGCYVVMRIHRHDMLNLTYQSNKIDKISTIGDVGIGMYVFTQSGHVAFGSTNDCTDSSCLQLFGVLKKIASENQSKGLRSAPEIYQLPKQPNLGQDKSHYQTLDIDSIDIGWVADNIDKLDRHIKSTNQDIKTLFGFNVEVDTWRIVRSDQTDVDWSVPKSRLMASMTLKTKTQTASDKLRIIDTTPQLLFANTKDQKNNISRTITMLEEQIGASSIEPTTYPLIIDADLGGMLAHEALGHPAESDLVESKGSVLSNNKAQYVVGKKIANSAVSIEDHESDLSHGYHPYGAFGNARMPVTIIDKGVLKESVSDVFSSTKIGVENKNCERSETYFSPAIPRMSNTYISMNNVQELDHPEGANLNDPHVLQSALKDKGIFEQHPKILYLIEMAGGQVAPVTGDFMFGTCFVYELSADGVQARKPVSFSGNVIGALEALEYGIGDVDKSTAGFCGKSEQTAHVRSGGNKLLFFAPTEKIKVA